ncbi:MAG: hypothetical protein U0Q11_04510 [Vicinamibacterales bacterium]
MRARVRDAVGAGNFATLEMAVNPRIGNGDTSTVSIAIWTSKA